MIENKPADLLAEAHRLIIESSKCDNGEYPARLRQFAAVLAEMDMATSLRRLGNESEKQTAIMRLIAERLLPVPSAGETEDDGSFGTGLIVTGTGFP